MAKDNTDMQKTIKGLDNVINQAEQKLYSIKNNLLLFSMMEWRCNYIGSKIYKLLNNDSYYNKDSALLRLMIRHHTEWLNRWQEKLEIAIKSRDENAIWIIMVGLEDQLYSMLEDFEAKIPKINAEIIANEYNLEKTSIPEVEKLLGGLTL